MVQMHRPELIATGRAVGLAEVVLMVPNATPSSNRHMARESIGVCIRRGHLLHSGRQPCGGWLRATSWMLVRWCQRGEASPYGLRPTGAPWAALEAVRRL